MLNAFMRPTCNPLFSTGIISNSVNLTWLPTDYDRQEVDSTAVGCLRKQAPACAATISIAEVCNSSVGLRT
ncbi:hypothetical protein HYQ45_002570 [Verticillium longisporum]|uniref:Uncharacterized protein n=1 Tax=Verticillium longisporum TaxID=100787 RepID=A0A8I2ZX69_VERLO|nr:hypothetical protein HYQ45_002570 [Verticillium longisporum]